MASRSGSYKATPAVALGSSFCKGAISSRSRKSTVGSTLPTSRSDSKSDRFGALEKETPAPSYANILAPNYISTPAYSHVNTSISAKSTLAQI